MSFFFSFTFVGLVRVCICMQGFSVEQSVMELVLKLCQSGTLMKAPMGVETQEK